MNVQLNEQQEFIRDAARDYAKRRLEPRAAWRDETGTFPDKEYKEMAELGFQGMNVPEAFGGSQTGVVAYSLAVTEIAAADASVAVGMSVTNMVAEALVKFAHEDVAKEHVTAICRGDYLAGAFALTEPGAGSDAGGLRTTADKVGDEYILNGSKIYITSADHAGVFIVMARTNRDQKGPKGVSAFAVPATTPGIKLGKKEKKMGQHGSSTLEVLFEDCRIPAKNLMAEEGKGFNVAMMALNGGRIGIGSLALGLGRAALEFSRDYALERKQFGKPIADNQAIQWKLADMATTLDAARLLVLRAAWMKEQGLAFTQEACMAKLYATETANEVCKEAIQILGGYGYVKDYPVERYYRDAKVTTLYEGTSEIQRLVIARNVLAPV